MDFVHKEITEDGFLYRKMYHDSDGTVYCVETKLVGDGEFSIKKGLPKVCTNEDVLNTYIKHISKILMEKNCGEKQQVEEGEKLQEEGNLSIRLKSHWDNREGDKREQEKEEIFVKMTIHDAMSEFLNACWEGKNSIVERFIDSGLNIDCTNHTNGTGLMYASKKGNYYIVNFLLANKAKVDLQDDEGNTALMLAASHGFIDIVSELLLAEADVHKKDFLGSTAIMRVNSRDTAIMELLERYETF